MKSVLNFVGATQMTFEARGSVAVIIPTFNHTAFLGAAIESVLAQTRPADEIIVIDDGSQDDPTAVVAAYKGVRIVRQANAGLAAARNRGIEETRSASLMFLDADDRLKPDAIALSLQSLGKSPGAAFAYGGYELVYPGKLRRRANYHPVHEDAFPAFLRINPVGMHGTVIYRRECLNAVGGFDPSLRACEDHDLYLRLAARYKVACRPDVLAEYWHHGGNMSHDPVTMLRWSERVFEARRGEAGAAGLLADLEAGKNWARDFYIGVWIGQLQAGSYRQSVRRGAALASMAPATMFTVLWSRLHKKLSGA
ncbi:glycosyltransferase [Croceicoccus sp. Ery5]|jgi:glycosyltransferase involved in cell wall biosynthesis|uniref:glycosyltransferase n=1 Tax=Croceicoccus sp. Ery5 TaxID=1703340 RepID=UPI001E507682|nr:glycosyltransferase [Croceicoccus sp. Ery5]